MEIYLSLKLQESAALDPAFQWYSLSHANTVYSFPFSPSHENLKKIIDFFS